MKKYSKKLITMLLAVVMMITAVMPVFAAEIQPRWSNISRFTININKYSGSYDVTVEGNPGTTNIQVTAVLYESATAGYSQKDSFTASRAAATLSASDTYSFNTAKSYKVVATARVTTNGITETVTLEKIA